MTSQHPIRNTRSLHANETILYAYITLCVYSSNGDDWCSLDSGYTTITDGHGYPHSVYISATRDGSIWLRSGRDHASLDWIYTDERRIRMQSVILDQTTIHLLESINYTDHCVLTDLDLAMTVDYGWHPSHLSIFDPVTKHSKVIVFKRNLECHRNTNLTLSRDKQGIVCEGGRRSACRRRTLADAAPAVFLKVVNFDPKGQEHWQCDEELELNSYTFKGSYYHIFVKLAACDTPKDSRIWGHEAKLRPNWDTATNMALIPDPVQGAISHGVIKGWHVFAKIISLHHVLYLQVWRPRSIDDRIYTLVGQTMFLPSELRFQEVTLRDESSSIRFRQGDVLGLYFPQFNPIAWSSVPCAFEQQRHLYAAFNTTDLFVGTSVRFSQATGDKSACRHYSFTAVLGEKSGAKSLEDWICPSGTIYSGTRRLSGPLDDPFHPHEKPFLYSDVISKGGRVSNTMTNDGRQSSRHSNDKMADALSPLYLVLLTTGGLLTLLLVTGLVSYCRALRMNK